MTAAPNITAAEFLGPSRAATLTARAKELKIAQLAQLRNEMIRHQPSDGTLAALSLADLHSIRDAFAPYAEGEVVLTTASAGCCCCCCPCCCCGCACSSCCV
jgi:hypothetical protein